MYRTNGGYCHRHQSSRMMSDDVPPLASLNSHILVLLRILSTREPRGISKVRCGSGIGSPETYQRSEHSEDAGGQRATRPRCTSAGRTNAREDEQNGGTDDTNVHRATNDGTRSTEPCWSSDANVYLSGFGSKGDNIGYNVAVCCHWSYMCMILSWQPPYAGKLVNWWSEYPLSLLVLTCLATFSWQFMYALRLRDNRFGTIKNIVVI